MRPISRPSIAALLLLALAAGPAVATDLKIATLAPEGTAFMNAMRAAGDEIRERTQGRVRVRFYPGGAMGNDQTVLRKIRIGQLHGGAVTSGALAGAYPDSQIYGLPVLFRSYEEVDFVRAQVDQKIIDGLARNGYIAFGIAEADFSYLLSSGPITSVADLKAHKAWMPEGDPISQAIFEAVGVSPVPLPLSDVLTGLQTGLIDTVASSPVGAVALQWFTKVKYLTHTPLLYIYGTIAVSEKAFSRISAADQVIVREAFGRAAKILNASSREENRKALEALKKQGITVVEPTPQETREWERIAAEARAALEKKGAYTPELYQEILRLLAEFRAGQAEEAAVD